MISPGNKVTGISKAAEVYCLYSQWKVILYLTLVVITIMQFPPSHVQRLPEFYPQTSGIPWTQVKRPPTPASKSTEDIC